MVAPPLPTGSSSRRHLSGLAWHGVERANGDITLYVTPEIRRRVTRQGDVPFAPMLCRQ